MKKGYDKKSQKDIGMYRNMHPKGRQPHCTMVIWIQVNEDQFVSFEKKRLVNETIKYLINEVKLQLSFLGVYDVVSDFIIDYSCQLLHICFR